MRACAECAGNARVCTVVLRALGVCAVVHVVSFSARGAQARLSPLAEAGRTPHHLPQGSTRSHHEETTYTRTPRTSLPPTFRGGGPPRIPGLHQSAQSV